MCFFFSSRRRHTRLQGDWSSDVCSSDLIPRSPGRPFRRRRSGPIVAGMIEVRDLSKRYGDKTAVDSLTFTVRPGVVTGDRKSVVEGKGEDVGVSRGVDKTNGRESKK